jgi:uncharacterized protein YjbI with pentapeptide repeats
LRGGIFSLADFNGADFNGADFNGAEFNGTERSDLFCIGNAEANLEGDFGGVFGRDNWIAGVEGILLLI